MLELELYLHTIIFMMTYRFIYIYCYMILVDLLRLARKKLSLPEFLLHALNYLFKFSLYLRSNVKLHYNDL